MNQNQRHPFCRTAALLLALMMLLSATAGLISCAEGDGGAATTAGTDPVTETPTTVGPTDATTPEGATSASPETTPGPADATTPEGETSASPETTPSETESETSGPSTSKRGTPYTDLEKNTSYSGKSLSILSREELKKTDFDLDSEGGGSALLGELVVARNSVIEADLGVKLAVTYATSYNEVNEIVERQVMGGLDEYDVAIGHKYSFTNCAQKNYLTDLNQVSTLDLSGEWWDQGGVKNLALRGKLFLATGDILQTSLLASSCFVFNKVMLGQLGKEEPYALVRSGDWTLDAFNQLTYEVTSDTNGDGQMEYDKDRYGFTTWMMDVPFSTFYGAGGMLVSNDENGEPALLEEYNTIIERYEKIYQAVIAQQAYFVTDETLYPTSYECFAEGHALFYDTTLGKIRNFLSEMDQDFGIVPVPKYDSAQTAYQSFVNGAAGFVMIIRTEQDPEFVGTILEAMARYNYENVSPRMYNVVVKSQNARDEDSSEMIEYIIYNRVYDLGYFFDLSISNSVLSQLKEGKPMGSSALKRTHRTSKSELKDLLKNLGQEPSKE